MTIRITLILAILLASGCYSPPPVKEVMDAMQELQRVNKEMEHRLELQKEYERGRRDSLIELQQKLEQEETLRRHREDLERHRKERQQGDPTDGEWI